MFNPYLGELMASGKYTTVGAALATSFARGCALARTGVGVTTCTPDRQVDSTECTMDIQTQTASIYSTWADTSDTVKTISSWNAAGAAAEAAVAFNLWRVSGGTGR